jgi:peptidoglycan/LPS O-acetylase OafA/YrhL
MAMAQPGSEWPSPPSPHSKPGFPSLPSSFAARQSYFPLFDGLRCLSIIAVVWFHATAGTYTSGILSRGNEGVSLFFVISGFLITTILLREQMSTGDISLKRFYLRRALRIFPLYYAILALYVILVIIIEEQSPSANRFWRDLPYFLTYTSNWFVPPSSERIIFVFAWSLATEEQFYCFWPWIIKATKRLRFPLATMTGLLALHYASVFAAANGALVPTSLVTRILVSISPPICLGAIAASLMHWSPTYRWIERWMGWRWSATAALFTTLLAMAIDAMPDWSLYGAMTWLVIACALRPDNQPLGNILTNSFVKHIGLISYGIYLMHLLCINLVRHLVPIANGPLLFALALPVVIAAATMSYWFFESPILRWKDRIARRPERPGADAEKALGSI